MTAKLIAAKNPLTVQGLGRPAVSGKIEAERGVVRGFGQELIDW